jgi:hypothetical protein
MPMRSNQKNFSNDNDATLTSSHTGPSEQHGKHSEAGYHPVAHRAHCNLFTSLKQLHWENSILLTEHAHNKLSWCIHKFSCHNRCLLSLSFPTPMIMIRTDSSDTDWGIVTPNAIFSGYVPPVQATQSRNWYEL